MRDHFDRPVSEAELFDAMMTLKSGKTPGGDGLTLEFYKKYWKLLVTPLLNMYKQGFLDGKMNPTGRLGLINLIPKKNRNMLEVKCWRGITLLNYDYKVWSKVIANRLEEVTYLIGKEQTGFIKGRSMFVNIKKTMEVISNLNQSGKPGIIVVIDFEKCFDRIEFESIRGVFEYFGFGQDFIKMLFMLFRDVESIKAVVLVR